MTARHIFVPIISGVLLAFVTLQSCGNEPDNSIAVDQPIDTISIDPAEALKLAEAIRASVAAEIAPGFELKLWASDSLVKDPVALAMDNVGNAYFTRANRPKNSEFDIRGHMDWAIESIGLETVEDRRQFLKKIFATEKSDENKWHADLNKDSIHDWRDLAVEKDEVYRVEDKDGDGIADFAQLFLADFNEEISDVANGVLHFNDDVYVTIAPDLWKLKDLDGDGTADSKESLSHGFGVHIGFGGHGLSGIVVGPDGRIYWGIGDIGANIVDKTGKRWNYSNEGVIARCNPDGSDFEIFAAGLRNTHEFVFDQFGNIFSEDNDGDHAGESERLVYIVNGSDAGWRINWQFGKYTDPDNNGYKVWMNEGLYKPRFEGQAAYIIPPILNYKNGPTGMKFNPGTALSEQWDNYFFLVEFVGAPARSTLNAFKFKPQGAGFEFDVDHQILKGVLATGIDFGPDGALYLADWIDGWGTKDYGRIWKLDVPDISAERKALRAETQQLLAADFSRENPANLENWLGHQDMRIRTKAQFELAGRGGKSLKTFQSAAATNQPQLKRIHGLWGMWQLARSNPKYAKNLIPFLQDKDLEIVAQATKILGDIRNKEAAPEIMPLLKSSSSRVRFFAAEAMGRAEYEPAIQPIIEMLTENEDQDLYLRHAGALALARIGKAEPVIACKDNPSRGVRIAAVVALRRMRHPGIAAFLKDSDEFIVTEAARAINDDLSIPDALPQLADVLKEERFTAEPLIRRAINANLRVGKEENLKNLIDFAYGSETPPALRSEAIATIGVWAKPSVLDRVDGRYRGQVERDPAAVKAAFEPVIADLLTSSETEIQQAAIIAAGKLKLESPASRIFELLQSSPSTAVRIAAIQSLFLVNFQDLDNALQLALNDKEKDVRVSALEIIPQTSLPQESQIALFASILQKASLEEQQSAITALGGIKSPAAVKQLDNQMSKLLAKKLDNGLELELENAIISQQDPGLTAKWEKYANSKNPDNVLALYSAALAGGKRRNGWEIFNSHEMAQCTRCHKIQGEGSDVGPALAGVGSRLSRNEILESLVAPSAKLAKGYAVETLTLNDGSQVVGFLLEENTKELSLNQGNGNLRTVAKKDIKERKTAPSSMPSMGALLNKSELRDVVEFLSILK